MIASTADGTPPWNLDRWDLYRGAAYSPVAPLLWRCRGAGSRTRRWRRAAPYRVRRPRRLSVHSGAVPVCVSQLGRRHPGRRRLDVRGADTRWRGRRGQLGGRRWVPGACPWLRARCALSRGPGTLPTPHWSSLVLMVGSKAVGRRGV